MRAPRVRSGEAGDLAHPGLVVAVALLLCGGAGLLAREGEVDLSPARWAAAERQGFEEQNLIVGQPKTVARSSHGVISGTSNILAVRSGLEALAQGGTAADAALTTALDQVCLAAGSWVSYAGIFTMVYYEAETGRVYSLNAAYNTVLGEDDPLSIPVRIEAGGEASGRTALVPGFMAGVQAAHDRFGRLPFEQLFVPAIHHAEQGYRLHTIHTSGLHRRKEVLARRAETREIFFDADGEIVEAGDLFRQPALAATLRQVAAEGADAIYHGKWAERFVEAVNEEGGRMTSDDLAGYEVIWSDPLRTTHNGYELYGLGLPAMGGLHAVEGLNLVEAGRITDHGPYTGSPLGFFWLSQIGYLGYLDYLEPAAVAGLFPRMDMSQEARATKEYAAELWPRIQEGSLHFFQAPEIDDPRHSDAIVAADAEGNVAAVVHSINTVSWGSTGIFVEGFSIPDSASFQQAQIKRAGPGKRLPDPTEPLIVLKDGKPVLALASIGGGLHERTLCALVNLLDHDAPIGEAVDGPALMLPEFTALGVPRPQVGEGEFSAELLEQLEELGMSVNVRRKGDHSARGWVVGAKLDGQTGEWSAGAPRLFNGGALGLK